MVAGGDPKDTLLDMGAFLTLVDIDNMVGEAFLKFIVQRTRDGKLIAAGEGLPSDTAEEGGESKSDQQSEKCVEDEENTGFCVFFSTET